MKAVFKRELKSYFSSPIGYVFVAIFFCVAGFMFSVYNISYQMGDISYVFNNMTMIFLFLTPLLTMRLLTEDKKAKTDQLLFTAPVKVTSVVMGKYLSALSVLGIALATTLVFPVILAIYTTPAWGEMFANYLGFVLMGGAFIAVGLYVSSFTENQIIAAIVTFAVLFLLYLSSSFSTAFHNVHIKNLVLWLSPETHYADFVKGVINIESVVYYLGLISAFIMLTAAHIEKRRWIK